MSTCRFCYGPIRFVTLDTGKPMPVEPHPFSDRGNVAACDHDGRLVGYVIAKDRPLREPFKTYVPHRAVCKPDRPRIAASQRPRDLFD